MASLLRQIVASPRARHPEAGIDLCYVTDNIIATSGPGATYPQVAYRTPLKDLVKFLDRKHGAQWAIWEFRAEGTGYPDSEVYGRVRHYPWPDHHPPPFALIPLIMASMRNWLREDGVSGRVVVVHCKAGKGRSGTVTCSYLISEEGWTPEAAMQRFTERRMRPGFGNGVSIPSQRRWITYVDRWTKGGKVYVERPMGIVELHVWGLRDGVKLVVEGFVDEGKTIKKFHTFQTSEREVVRGRVQSNQGFADVALEAMGRKKTINANATQQLDGQDSTSSTERAAASPIDAEQVSGADAVFRPSSRVVLPSSDINIDIERRNKTRYGGFTMVTSVAHVWFNTFFEGRGPEQDGTPDDSGVFEIEWEALDGLKGSSRKGTRAFDRMAVVWKAVHLDRTSSVVINEPSVGQEVQQAAPADWRGASDKSPPLHTLGLRPETNESAEVSRASSLRSGQTSQSTYGSEEELQGVRASGPGGEPNLDVNGDTSPIQPMSNNSEPTKDTTSTVLSDTALTEPTQQLEGSETEGDAIPHISTAELPGGVPEEEMQDHKDRSIGHVSRNGNSTSSS